MWENLNNGKENTEMLIPLLCLSMWDAADGKAETLSNFFFQKK